jgi:hypothetical protein
MAFDLIKRVTDLIAPDEGSGLPDPFFFNDCAIRASARLERGDTTLLGFMTATRPEPTRDAWRVSHRYLSLLRLEQIAQPQIMLANEAHVLVDLCRLRYPGDQACWDPLSPNCCATWPIRPRA